MTWNVTSGSFANARRKAICQQGKRSGYQRLSVHDVTIHRGWTARKITGPMSPAGCGFSVLKPGSLGSINALLGVFSTAIDTLLVPAWTAGVTSSGPGPQTGGNVYPLTVTTATS